MSVLASLLLALPFLSTMGSAGPIGQTGEQDVTALLPARRTEPSSATLEHHVRFLSDPARRGRAIGSPEAELVARYLVAALERAGWEPGVGPEASGAPEGNDERGYLLQVPLHELVYQEPPTLVFRTEAGDELRGTCGVEFFVQARGAAASVGPLPIRTVSFIKRYIPDPDPKSAIYVEGDKKRRRALLKRTGLEDLAGFGLELEANIDVRHSAPGPKPIVPRTQRLREDELDQGCERIILRGDLLREFVQNRDIVSVELNVPVEQRQLRSFDVVAVLPGRGTPERPELAREAVVVSAAYDHRGQISAGRREGEYFHGAQEAASVAAVLELAEALAEKPLARTVVLVLTAADAEQSAGRYAYVDNPARPIERTVLWLNLDRFGVPDPELSAEVPLWLSGSDRSDLLEALGRHGIALSPDPRTFTKSYARLGDMDLGLRDVLAHSVSSFNYADRGGDASADELDYGHVLTATRLVQRIVERVGAGDVRPTWHEGKKPRSLAERIEASRNRVVTEDDDEGDGEDG